jgi:hypothetical protein
MAVETGRPVNLVAPPASMDPKLVGQEVPVFPYPTTTSYQMSQAEILAAGG